MNRKKSQCLLLFAVIVSLCLGLSQRCAAQDFTPDTTVDSSQDSARQRLRRCRRLHLRPRFPRLPSITPATDQDPDRDVSWKRVLLNAAHDQKPIWLFPVAVARGHHLVPTISVVALTVGLIVADRYDSAYFHRTQTFNGFDKVFSGRNTADGTWIFPLGFDFASWLRKDKYGERTAVLSGEAVLDSEIVTLAMKDIDRRWRPWEASTRGNGTYTDTWFKTSGDYLGGSGNFPSGHTIAAFSVATVFADRYPRYRWLAYALAGAIGFSRISLQSHFPSDVFLGSVLGYSIAHYVVLQR